MNKVILINDCKFESFIMEDMLSDLGYSVVSTNEGEALSKIKKINPDIVICNLIMKNITGDKLIKSIKDKNQHIICMLSSSNLIRIEDYDKNYIYDIIHTPIDKDELGTILNKVAQKDKIVQKDNEEINLDKIKDEFSFCPYCGEKLKEGFLFCPSCGHKI